MTKRYFITVDWCNKGQRGIFCDKEGCPFSQEKAHTDDEMNEILGHFWMILSPKSESLSGTEIKEYSLWRGLAEYKNQYGIALKGEK